MFESFLASKRVGYNGEAVDLKVEFLKDLQ